MQLNRPLPPLPSFPDRILRYMESAMARTGACTGRGNGRFESHFPRCVQVASYACINCGPPASVAPVACTKLIIERATEQLILGA